ncbi:MAG: SurA N-terminal domain-containing protein [Candidatus Pacebacteria bacterium]|nr:SurA N-terminal domain-containing protein [Candidatus Paceibacterota bacterium]
MSENEKQTPKNTEVEAKVESKERKVETLSTTVTVNKTAIKNYVVAVLVVSVTIFVALYLMEKEGRSKTNIFESVLAAQEARSVIAVVNGEKIVNSDLTTSIEQFSQAAAAQGVDISSPDALAEIRIQALDVLINTKLLKQEASDKGLSVTEEEATERLAAIETEIGGADVLAERMGSLGITVEQLKIDIRDELVIQQLLDVVFAEAEISVSEDDILEIYNNAGGEEAGLPPLKEVREQIEVQAKTNKEQAVIDEYLNDLKEGADIELL